LEAQVGGHFLALGFVGGQDGFAEDRAGAIPRSGQKIWIMGFDQIHQIPHDSENSVRWLTGWTGHGWYRVVNLVD
jgi:hypothetical protein